MTDSPSSDNTLQRDAAMARVADLCTTEDGGESADPCPDDEVWQRLLESGDGLIEHKDLMRHMARCTDCRILYAHLAAIKSSTAHIPVKKTTRAWWRYGLVAACLCLALGTVLWHMQTASPRNLALAVVQDLVRQAPGSRSSDALPWDGLTLSASLDTYWQAYAAGLWQARADAAMPVGEFPDLWLVAGSAPLSWQTDLPDPYVYGYSMQAVQILCAGKTELPQQSAEALATLVPSLPKNERQCRPLLQAAQQADTQFRAQLQQAN